MITKPKGTYDVLNFDARNYNYIEEVIHTFARLYNYDYIRTPIFESKELFHRGVGETTDIVTKETYDFQDKKGRDLTLRPEGTAGIARSYIENKMYGNNDLTKLYYFGTMYRYERPQAGRNREFTQFGMEALGSNDPSIDAEMISLPIRIFESLGIKNLKVKINSLGDTESRNNYSKALKNYLEPHINELCSDCKERFKKNPLRILDCKVDGENDIIKNAPRVLDFLNKESKERFAKVLNYLDTMDIDYEIDPNVVRGLDYYDHTVFEIVADIKELSTGNVLAGGGRYNSLVKNLGGPDTPAIGFACGIERVLFTINTLELKCADEKSLDVFVLYVNDEEKEHATYLAQELRLNGFSTDVDYLGKNLKAQFKEADKYNSKYLIILNSEDLKDGMLELKDNLTKDKKKIKEINLIDELDGNM